MCYSLRYPACNPHAKYCHLWPPGSTIFFDIFSQTTRFAKKQNKTCVLIFSTSFVWNISHSKINRVRYDQKIYIGLYVKYSLFFPAFNETWIFWADFRKILKYQTSLTSVPWARSCSMLAGGPTDRRGTTKLKVALRNFANAPLMVSILSIHCNVVSYSTQSSRHPAPTCATYNTNQQRHWKELRVAGQKITCSYGIVFRNACNCAPSCVWQIYTITVRLI